MLNARAVLFLGLSVLGGNLAMAPNANATVVTISLAGVIFSDGGTASGSFAFDTSSGNASNFTVWTSTTASYTGASYGAGSTGGWNALNYASDGKYYDNIVIENATGDTIFLDYVESDANGAADIAAAPESFNTLTTYGNDPFGPSYEYFQNGSEFFSRTVVHGASPTPTPEPASLALFGFALAGLAAIGRRQARVG
jgi:PEP-CTERM motif